MLNFLTFIQLGKKSKSNVLIIILNLSQAPYVTTSPLLKEYEAQQHKAFSQQVPLRNQMKHTSNPNLNGISIETGCHPNPGVFNGSPTETAKQGLNCNGVRQQLTIHYNNHSSLSPNNNQSSPSLSGSNLNLNNFNNCNSNSNDNLNNFKSASSNFDTGMRHQDGQNGHRLNEKSEFFLDREYNNINKNGSIRNHKGLSGFNKKLAKSSYLDECCFDKSPTYTTCNNNNNYDKVNTHDSSSYFTINKNYLMNYTCSIERYKSGLSSKSNEQWDKPAAATAATTTKPATQQPADQQQSARQSSPSKLRTYQQHAPATRCTTTSSNDPRRRTFFI